MPAGDVLETLQNRFSHIIIGTTLIGALSFVALPWISSSLFLAAGVHLLLNLNSPEPFEYNFNFSLLLLATVFGVGLLFSYANILAHLLVGALACGGMSTFFISECVIKSQQALPDENIEFSSVFSELGQYAQNPFLQDFKNWCQSIKIWLTNRSQQNREIFYEASSTLWETFKIPFTHVCENAFRYLRQQTREDELPATSETTDNDNDPVVIDLSDPAPTVVNSPRSSEREESDDMPDEDPSIVSANRKSNAI